MRNSLFIPCLSIILLLACNDENEPKISGSGNVISVQRTVETYSKIDISSVINANIIYSTTPSLTIRADDNIIDLVQTEVDRDELFVSLGSGSYEDITINVTIVNPELQTLSMSGVNNVSVSGYEDLPRLDVSISGVGNLEMSGSANELNIVNSGSTNLSGFDFTSSNCSVNVSGVGKVEITAIDLLSGIVSGVGNVFYKGSPEVQVSVSGVGNVIDSN